MNETYAFIEAEKTTHGVAFLCRLLNVARSSFYAWQAAAKARAARQAADEALAHEITVIYVASRHTYGLPRIHAELRRLGRAVNRKRVARVMRERGIQGAHRRRRRSLTRPDKKARPAPDLIGRDFHAERPGTKLVGTSPASPPPRAGSTSPAGWTWPPARSSDTRWPPTTAPPSSSTP
ncbi:integrase [Streptomyces viridosporus ATCC 14672]|uniref:Integrase n=1 Tax=Streptomyces viridosporus (strain ATCC 14672 / DSM 40746 / JCM 4963 / KCTC 9882 / NRRL B-12104 / FH 1290) TaxID=566461 RepID=D6A8P3_STRV1|nr:IS3 family transposase [Streptomyces viridosporus]EFE72026.1 integrase [Streptomyces viridosporus ATCC 14672]